MLGLFNNGIEVVYGEEDKPLQTYSFVSFTNRNIAFKRITNVWKSFQKTNGLRSVISDSDNDNDEEETVLDNTSMLSTSMTHNSGEEVFFPPLEQETLWESNKYIFKLTLESFYDKFIKDDAEISIASIFQKLGNTEISCTPWQDLDETTKSRELNFRIKIVGTPFVSSTRVNKTQTLKKEENKITLKSSSKSLDVPYSSYFLVEDTWEVLPYEGDKCIFRLYMNVNFIKSTMWKSKIIDKSKSEGKIQNDLWLEEIKKQGIIWEEFMKRKSVVKSVNSEVHLSHALEKQYNLTELPITKRIIFNVKKFLYEIYHSNKKDIFYITILLIILLYVYSLSNKLNKIIHKLENNSLQYNCPSNNIVPL